LFISEREITLHGVDFLKDYFSIISLAHEMEAATAGNPMVLVSRIREW